MQYSEYKKNFDLIKFAGINQFLLQNNIIKSIIDDQVKNLLFLNMPYTIKKLLVDFLELQRTI
jgi:hypothetical protein